MTAADLVALIIMATGTVMLPWLVLDSIPRALASRNWPIAEGTLTHANVKQELTHGDSELPPNSNSSVDVTYEYHIGGACYTGTKLSIGQLSYATRRSAEARAREIRAQSHVRVYYNPADPKDSVLEPGMTLTLWSFLVDAIAFLAYGGWHFYRLIIAP